MGLLTQGTLAESRDDFPDVVAHQQGQLVGKGEETLCGNEVWCLELSNRARRVVPAS